MDIDTNFQKNFKRIRKSKGLTQEQVANFLGVTKSLINQWESGKANISFDKIIKLSDAYGIDINEFNDLEDEKGNKYYKVPLLGKIACGIPIFAQENIEMYHFLPIEYRAKGQFFYLQAQGDSMIDLGINQGDYLLMRSQTTLSKNQVGGFLFKDETEVNLKIYHPTKNKIILKSANKDYDDIVIEKENLDKLIIFSKLEKVVKEKDCNMQLINESNNI